MTLFLKAHTPSRTSLGATGGNRLLSISVALLLSACGGSNTPDTSAAANAAPVYDAAGCSVYGVRPRAVVPVSLDLALNNLLNAIVNSCTLHSGEMMTWSDANGTPRVACLIKAPQTSPSQPMPLLVYLPPTLVGLDSVLFSGLAPLTATGQLAADPSQPGFNLLIPVPRNIEQFLPAPLDYGVGWDHWYRNLNRGSDYLNPDVAAIDHFIEASKAKGIVDSKRIFVTGHSEGADMGTLYGLNTPGIAATRVFSTISPFDDPADPCPQAPTATNIRPYFVTERACDTGNACKAGNQFLDELRAGVLPVVDVGGEILDLSGKVVSACDATCEDPNPNFTDFLREQANHLLWPVSRNAEFLAYLRAHPLP